MRIRRSRLEICYKILNTVAEEEISSKTHIMYRANLSFRQLQNFLSLLLERDLIREVGEGTKDVFEITEKGRVFLDSFQKVKQVMGED